MLPIKIALELVWLNSAQTKELLTLIEKDSRYDEETLADLLNVTKEDVKKRIQQLEEAKIIVKYPTLVNWEKFDENGSVTAMIDVKVTPKRDVGFDSIASRIYRFPEVKTVYLVSGAYDLSVMVEGKTMKEVAYFVAQKLSSLDSVVSTATHFLLKTYKHDGVVFEEGDDDKRMVVTP